MSKVSTWSATAASNNSVSPDGFPENMPPSGVNNSSREVMAQVRTERENADWFDWGVTPTYISASSFSLVGDVTTEWHVGRRVRLTDASTLYATILTSTYTSLTTLTLTMDSGSVSASLSAAELGTSSEDNDSLPDKVVKKTATQTLTNKAIDSDGNTITNIVNADIKAAAAIDASKLANGTVSNTELQYINSLSSNAQTQLDTKAETSVTILDVPELLFQDSTGTEAWTTLNSATLNSAQAITAIVKAVAITQTGTASISDFEEATLNLAAGGTSPAIDGFALSAKSLSRCSVVGEITSDTSINTDYINLDANYDFEYYTHLSSSGVGLGKLILYLVGYIS